MTVLTSVSNLLHLCNELWFRKSICFITKGNLDDAKNLNNKTLSGFTE